MVKITVLVDDLNGAINGFVCSYGFSALIELDENKILFDTGTEEEPLAKNLKLMGYSPKDLDAVILSHNHYDHTNGLPILLKDNPDLPVYVHKKWDKDINYKGCKIPTRNKIILEHGNCVDDINSNIFITDSFYSSDYGGVYEHACYIKKNSHFILICGCCHPGLNKFLQNRERLKINTDSLTIMGGLHGFRFSDNEAENINPKLDEIILCHCTSNIKTYQNQFKEKCSIGLVGKTYLF
ncbi:MAG: MBL fold metallo-hydrolase [Promethearchaeati archaeon]